MDLEIDSSSFLSGTITPPASKSYGQRALSAAFLIPKLTITNLGESSDERAVLEILKQCGMKIVLDDNRILIENCFDFKTKIILECGESGLCARLFSAFFCLNEEETTIEGSGSLRRRSMIDIEDFYKQLEIEYSTNGSRLPIQFKGKKVQKNIVINGSDSSQYVTGILYYLVGVNADEVLQLEIINPSSSSYIDMTIQLLQDLGAQVKRLDRENISVSPCSLKNNHEIRIEADWSSAAFWMVAAAINGDIQFENLNLNSLQPDRAVMDVLVQVGAIISIEDSRIRIQKAEQLKAFEYDASDSPDLIPILSVLAVFCTGESKIVGIHRLENKESNRKEAILSEFRKLKIDIKINDNSFIIKGVEKNFYCDFLDIDSYNDHRIAMSMMILVLNLHKKARIRNFSCIEKSYPRFLNDLNSLTSTEIGRLCNDSRKAFN